MFINFTFVYNNAHHSFLNCRHFLFVWKERQINKLISWRNEETWIFHGTDNCETVRQIKRGRNIRNRYKPVAINIYWWIHCCGFFCWWLSIPFQHIEKALLILSNLLNNQMLTYFFFLYNTHIRNFTMLLVFTFSISVLLSNLFSDCDVHKEFNPCTVQFWAKVRLNEHN